MGDYSVPQHIRDQRPSGTMVKKQKGHYYVYEYTSTSVKVTLEDGTSKWKTTMKMGPCIGQITESDGFIPNNNSLRSGEKTVLEYGGYFFIKQCSEPTFNLLKEVFNADDAAQIYAVACVFVAEGFTDMKNISAFYEESVLSCFFPSLKMGRDALHTLYDQLGRKGGLADKFEQLLLERSSRKIAIDEHVIACTASNSDLSVYGYKSKKIGSEQINWIAAYDVQTGKPLVNQMFNGADPDKTSVQILFSRFQFNNTLFLADRGFNTETDKKLMSENGNAYIVPMISGRKDYVWVYGQIRFDKRKNFIYDKDGYFSLIYYQEFCPENDKRYFAFLDTTRQSAERAAYLKKIGEHAKGYTREGLSENEKGFGLFLIETSDMEKSAKQIFYNYKSRWGIETFYDYIDNTLDFNALYQQDYCRMQGLSFIMQIAGMIFNDLKDITDKNNISFTNAMLLLKGIKVVRERKRWMIRNVNKERRKLCEKLGLSLPVIFET